MSLAEADAKPVAPSESLLRRDRYVATNRFTVRNGKGAKFEQRWATRKSRLASLEGFKYFQLMRRVKLSDDAPDYESDPFDYVSFTIWDQKRHFNAWRAGEAFKEAHGGTSLTAFIGAMVSSLRVLKGAPRPAFYDGLLMQSTVPATVPTTVDGWRADVEADGVASLPAECFVAMNKFVVLPGQEAAFEQRWAARKSQLSKCDGFVSFSMLRRDAKAKGHGVAPLSEDEPNYTSCTIWRDRAAFDAWRSGQAFGQAHGQKPASSAGGDAAEAPKPAPMWARPPSPVFYEGVLVISSPEGA